MGKKKLLRLEDVARLDLFRCDGVCSIERDPDCGVICQEFREHPVGVGATGLSRGGEVDVSGIEISGIEISGRFV